jgi:hypothetical protein
MATELGERIKHEGEKLRALELVTLPARKKQPKKRSKFKTFTLVSVCAGIGYAVFRALRERASSRDTFTSRPTERPETSSAKNGSRDPHMATATP